MLLLSLLAVAAGFKAAVADSPFAAPRNNSHGLIARWDKSKTADDELWSKTICRGTQFMEAMKGSDEDAGKIFQRNPPTLQSPFQGDLKIDFEKWGWHEVDADDEFFCDYSTWWKYDTAYNALGLNKKPKFKGWPKTLIPNGGDNVCYGYEHGDLVKFVNGDHVPVLQQTYKVDGKEYSKTGASCRVAINYVGGSITTQARTSPMNAAKTYWKWEPQSSELPALRSSADILWGLWYRDNPDIKNIRFFWAQTIINEQTSALIASALKMWGKELEGWPGTTFSTVESDEGLALMGSPNALAYSWFLISHKKELGNKMITKVRVFWGNENDNNDEKWRYPEMLLYVEDVPQVEGEPVDTVPEIVEPPGVFK